MSAKIQEGKGLSELDIVKLTIAPLTVPKSRQLSMFADCIDLAKRGIEDPSMRVRTVARLIVTGSQIFDKTFMDKAMEGLNMDDLERAIEDFIPEDMLLEMFPNFFAKVKAKVKDVLEAQVKAELAAKLSKARVEAQVKAELATELLKAKMKAEVEAKAEAKEKKMALARALLADGVSLETVKRNLKISQKKTSTLLSN